MKPVVRICFNLFLAAAAVAACAGGGDPDGKLAALEQRLTDEEIIRLVARGTPASAVQEQFGAPARAYVSSEDTETWEYRLSGSPHPRTLFVEVGGEVVKDAYVLERRGATTRPSTPHN